MGEKETEPEIEGVKGSKSNSDNRASNLNLSKSNINRSLDEGEESSAEGSGPGAQRGLNLNSPKSNVD